MESKTKNRKTRNQISSMVKRAFGEVGLANRDDAVTELKQGWFNAAYEIQLEDGKEVVLKIAPPLEAEVMIYEKNLMATEVASMRLVHSNPAIPVPEIVYFDDSHEVCDSDYFFMDKIYGDNLEQIYENLQPEKKTSIDLEIGAIIREINKFPGNFFGYQGNADLQSDTWKEAFLKIMESVLEDGLHKNVTYDFPYNDIRAAIMRHADALEEIESPCLVHWDAWNPNFFVKNDHINGIIDFERALWAEPLMEAQFRQFFNDGITDSMRGYGKTSFTFPEQQRNQLYSLHLALVMNTECFYRNYDTDDIFNFSRQYIGKTMEWLQTH